MSAVSVWTLFAFMSDDGEGKQDERRRIAQWQIEDSVRWAMARGYDNIYLSRDPVETTHFERKSPVLRLHYSEERDAQPGDAA